MKTAGVLESERHYSWTIYRLPRKPHPVLEENLKCLQDIRREEPAFAADLRRRKEVVRRIGKSAANCPPAVSVEGKS